MGKRFILSILALFIFAGASLAYENPRWFSMPVKIYSANSENSMLISRAAQSWQTSSGGTVRFTCNNSKNILIKFTYEFNIFTTKPFLK